MAVYKVPQDVEADDKLIGPFSFRQFIYIIIAVIAGALAWGLAQLFIPLAIIPIPIVIFFGILALPLRKDQPMEIYLAAVVAFHMKPKKRLWQPDGIQSLVQITAPKVVEVIRSKDLSQDEADKRFTYLADIVDTRGWAVRGTAMPQDTAMRNEVYTEAQQTTDVLDRNSGVAQSFDTMINQSTTKRRDELVQRMQYQQPQPQEKLYTTPPPLQDPYTTLQNPSTPQPDPNIQVNYDPYPNAIHQRVISPIGEEPPQPELQQPIEPTPPASQEYTSPEAAVAQAYQPENQPASTSNEVVSPDIINLANNSDLSIETLAHEANRIHQKEESSDDEVVISLR